MIRNYLSGLKNIPFSKRFSIFSLLVVMYYFVNISTSSANSGMSGKLLADNNIYNQLLAGVIIAYTVYFTFMERKVFPKIRKTCMLLVSYLVFRFGVLLLFDTKFAMSQVNPVFTFILWLSVLSFSITNMRLLAKEDAEKLLQIICATALFFAAYKIYTQRSILISEGIVAGINAAGSVYMILPLSVAVLKGKPRIIVFIICFFLCVLSAKRQALLGFTIISIFVLKDILFSYFINFKFFGVIVLLLVFLFAQNQIVSTFDAMSERQARIEEVGGTVDSGREELRNSAIKGFANADLVKQIFGGGTGQGANYIRQYFGVFNYPHCGFIEILCDYGAVGIIFFIYLICQMFNACCVLKKSEYRRIGYMLILALLFVNTVSHVGNINVMFLVLAFSYIYTYNN